MMTREQFQELKAGDKIRVNLLGDVFEVLEPNDDKTEVNCVMNNGQDFEGDFYKTFTIDDTTFYDLELLT